MSDELKQPNENKDSTFAYLQKVKIVNGFYKGRYGKVQSFNGKTYVIECVIDDKKTIINCKESDIRAQKTLW